MIKKRVLSETDRSELLEFISLQLIKNGIKQTSMDSLATAMHISKRTLYEIFSSKEAMFLEAFDYSRKKTEKRIKEIFQDSTNMMEGILKCFLYNRDIMSYVSVEFFREINNYYQSVHNSQEIKECNNKRYLYLYDIILKGIKEGYFRKDLNLIVQCRMFMIQMESLKRTEELFPPDITLLEVYDNITLSFLRGMATAKGLEELEKLKDNFKEGTLKTETK